MAKSRFYVSNEIFNIKHSNPNFDYKDIVSLYRHYRQVFLDTNDISKINHLISRNPGNSIIHLFLYDISTYFNFIPEKFTALIFLFISVIGFLILFRLIGVLYASKKDLPVVICGLYIFNPYFVSQIPSFDMLVQSLTIIIVYLILTLKKRYSNFRLTAFILLLFLTYTLSSAMLVVYSISILYLILSRQINFLKLLLICSSLLFGIYWFLLSKLGFTFNEIFLQPSRHHFIFNEFLRTKNMYSNIGIYLHNITYYLFSLGPAVAFILILNFTNKKFLRKKNSIKILFVSTVIVFILLTIIDYNSLETARLWAFITPFFLLICCSVLAQYNRIFKIGIIINQLLFYFIIFNYIPLFLNEFDLKFLIPTY